MFLCHWHHKHAKLAYAPSKVVIEPCGSMAHDYVPGQRWTIVIGICQQKNATVHLGREICKQKLLCSHNIDGFLSCFVSLIHMLLLDCLCMESYRKWIEIQLLTALDLRVSSFCLLY